MELELMPMVMTMINNFTNMIISVTQFFQVQQAIKMHHWVTSDYSTHVLLDDFLKDYSKLVDDIVENFLSHHGNSLEILDVQPYDAAFSSLESLLQLAGVSFDEVRENIDKMPKGMRTILDEVDTTLRKYSYLFRKLPNSVA
jgi:DNA-binding ferritin-like protein